MRSNKAFTKTDLLVLILGVLFLLANLGAINSAGHRRAKNALCITNLHRWGIIYQNYIDDNGGLFPGDYGISKAYYKDERLWLCPAATKTTQQGGTMPYASYYGSSYGSNGYCHSKAVFATQTDNMMWKTPYQANAGQIPVFLDHSCGGGVPHRTDNPPAYEGEPYWGDTNRDEIKGFCITRHFGGINGLFCDFSVRWVSPKQLWNIPWSRTWFDEPLNSLVQNGQWPEWMQNFKDY